MCVNYISDWCKRKTGYGWKIFYKMGTRLLHPTARTYIKKEKRGKWIQACKPLPHSFITTSPNYSKGFHLYKTKKMAKEQSYHHNMYLVVILKVFYRGLICSGFNNDNDKIIVANEIMVPKEKKCKRKYQKSCRKQ